ncbi:phosphate starvation-inducible PhoH-like protein [Pseudomonas sp. W4I3]|nr:phosphate starvation-inducible PhoH-like protein [Pseudomonas sp. W4I3]
MNAPTAEPHRFLLEPFEARRFANLCGQFDEHLRLIEQRLSIEIRNRGNQFELIGEPHHTTSAENLLRRLYRETKGSELSPETVHLYLQESAVEDLANNPVAEASVALRTKKGMIRPRGLNQQKYVKEILGNDINFGIGPAGTGKTYLAVACAVDALEREQVRRILLVRPAVEAGEKLGFLPGDLAQKIDPYLRPLYDALYEMLGFEYVAKLIERQVIEIAPLAYMRGRTLNNSFIILDESQNTTVEQMKMFLTRIGFGSTAVITGDITQVDLPQGHQVRPGPGDRSAQGRARHQLYAFHAQGRGAPPTGAAHCRGLRAFRTPRRRPVEGRTPRCLSLTCNWPPKRPRPAKPGSVSGVSWPCASAPPIRS